MKPSKTLTVVELVLMANGRVKVTLREGVDKYIEIQRDLDEACKLHIDQKVTFAIVPAEPDA